VACISSVVPQEEVQVKPCENVISGSWSGSKNMAAPWGDTGLHVLQGSFPKELSYLLNTSFFPGLHQEFVVSMMRTPNRSRGTAAPRAIANREEVPPVGNSEVSAANVGTVEEDVADERAAELGAEGAQSASVGGDRGRSLRSASRRTTNSFVVSSSQ